MVSHVNNLGLGESNVQEIQGNDIHGGENIGNLEMSLPQSQSQISFHELIMPDVI